MPLQSLPFHRLPSNLQYLNFRIVDSGQHVLKRSDVQLKAPIHNPEKLICIGMNYVDHCLEQNVPLPTEPILFSKFNNAITDPGAPIIYPEETQVCIITNLSTTQGIPKHHGIVMGI